MDVDTSKQSEEAAHALAAAKALGQKKGNTSSSGFQDITDALHELDMEHYDDEDDGIFIPVDALILIFRWPAHHILLSVF